MVIEIKKLPKAVLITIFFFIILSGLLLFTEWMLTETQILPHLDGGILNPTQTLSIEIIRQKSLLLASWTIAVIGSSAFLSRPYLENKQFKFIIFSTLIVVFFSSIFSLFLSQVILDILLRALLIEQNALSNNKLYLAIRMQYLSFIVSVFGFFMISIISVAYPREDQVSQ